MNLINQVRRVSKPWAHAAAWIALMVAVTLAGCVTPHPAGSVRWSKSDIPGLMIERIDPIALEWLSFGEKGYVAVTVGERNGEMMSPLFYWRVSKGLLEIVDHQGETFEELTLLHREPKRIIARRRNGRTVEYKVLRGSFH